MADDPKNGNANPPAPEALKTQAEVTPDAETSEVVKEAAAAPKRTIRRRGAYRASHKATFLGLAMVGVILAVNAGVIAFIINGQTQQAAKANEAQVTINAATLDKLGVNRNTVGNTGAQLTVNPDAKFNGQLVVGKDVSIAGQLKLNSKFVANDASLSKLDAGNVTIAQLAVSSDVTGNNLNSRRDLSVVGASRLQGPVTMSQLLTVNNNVNIAGTVSVGGALSVRTLQVNSFVTETTLTIGGHIITRGSSPGVSPGSNLGQNGTVSISGNDAAGTVAVNIGAGGGSGILAHVTFARAYSSTPHVVVTQVGAGGSGVYVTRTATGFSVGVNGSLGPGGYAYDFIVMQ